MIHKVYAYVVRKEQHEKQLLVFEHVNMSEAGIQVPKGTVERDEDWAAAVLRELAEETGLQHASIVRFLTSDYEELEGERINRHFYLLAVDEAQDEWLYEPKGHAEEQQKLTFKCYWINEDELDRIVKPMGDYAYLAFR